MEKRNIGLSDSSRGQRTLGVIDFPPLLFNFNIASYFTKLLCNVHVTIDTIYLRGFGPKVSMIYDSQIWETLSSYNLFWLRDGNSTEHTLTQDVVIPRPSPSFPSLAWSLNHTASDGQEPWNDTTQDAQIMRIWKLIPKQCGRYSTKCLFQNVKPFSYYPLLVWVIA